MKCKYQPDAALNQKGVLKTYRKINKRRGPWDLILTHISVNQFFFFAAGPSHQLRYFVSSLRTRSFEALKMPSSNKSAWDAADAKLSVSFLTCSIMLNIKSKGVSLWVEECAKCLVSQRRLLLRGSNRSTRSKALAPVVPLPQTKSIVVDQAFWDMKGVARDLDGRFGLFKKDHLDMGG